MHAENSHFIFNFVHHIYDTILFSIHVFFFTCIMYRVFPKVCNRNRLLSAHEWDAYAKRVRARVRLVFRRLHPDLGGCRFRIWSHCVVWLRRNRQVCYWRDCVRFWRCKSGANAADVRRLHRENREKDSRTSRYFVSLARSLHVTDHC